MEFNYPLSSVRAPQDLKDRPDVCQAPVGESSVALLQFQTAHGLSATGFIHTLLFPMAEMDMPIARSGTTVAAVIAAPVSKVVGGSPLTRLKYCSTPARSIKTATTSATP